MGLLAAGFGLGHYQTIARNGGKTDLPSLALRTIVDPPAHAIGAGIDGLSNFTYGFLHSSSLVAENRRLKAIADAESLYNQRLLILGNEIDQLKKLEGYSNFGPKKRITARVIGVFPDENRVTISAGSSEGITPGVPVVAADGLLGVVQTADPHTSQVTLITSPLPFKIGAVVERKPPSAGLIHGEDWNRLELDLSLNAPVQTGDIVVTSGFSDKIPRGIPIGRIVRVTEDKDFGTIKAQVVPSVQVGDVQEVFALK